MSGRTVSRDHADMMALDFAAQAVAPGLVINTSCEHLDDVPGWLATCRQACRCCCNRTTMSASPTTAAASPRSRPSRSRRFVRDLVRGRAADEELYALHADRRAMSSAARAAVAIAMKGYPRLSETFIAQELLGLAAARPVLRIWSLRHPTDAATAI
jgi:hypothetical protein